VLFLIRHESLGLLMLRPGRQFEECHQSPGGEYVYLRGSGPGPGHAQGASFIIRGRPS